MPKKKKHSNANGIQKGVAKGREMTVGRIWLNCTHTFMSTSCQVCIYCLPHPDLPGFFYCAEGGKGLLDLSGNVSLEDQDLDLK